jgi:hemerythrin
MTLLAWSDSLAVQHAQMDTTHQEFVQLIQQVEAALGGPAEALLRCYDEMSAHTVEHFAQEDRWMVATGFAAENCHSMQHRQVLAVLKEVGRLARDEGKLEFIGQLLPELARWFEHHAQVVDAGLAQHLQSVGFDTQSGHIERPPETAIAGCGSLSCTDA